jgi:hypothetical protein
VVIFSASLATVCPSFGHEMSARKHSSRLDTRWCGACDGSARVPSLSPTGQCSVPRLVRLQKTVTLHLKNHTTYTCNRPCPCHEVIQEEEGYSSTVYAKNIPCVGPRGDLDNLKKRKISCSCLESNPESSRS